MLKNVKIVSKITLISKELQVIGTRTHVHTHTRVGVPRYILNFNWNKECIRKYK